MEWLILECRLEGGVGAVEAWAAGLLMLLDITKWYGWFLWIMRIGRHVVKNRTTHWENLAISPVSEIVISISLLNAGWFNYGALTVRRGWFHDQGATDIIVTFCTDSQQTYMYVSNKELQSELTITTLYIRT